MVLDDDGLEVTDPGRDGGVIFGRDRLRIEEVAGIVELDVLRAGRLRQGVVDLGRDRSDGNSLIQRVLPEITHRAAERTLLVRQEDRRDVLNSPRSSSLRFDQVRVRSPRIERLLRRAGGENVGIEHGWLWRVQWGRCHPPLNGL